MNRGSNSTNIFFSDRRNALSIFFFVFTLVVSGCSSSDEGVKTPTISSINISQGAVGMSVVITGSNFSSIISDNVVTFNGTQSVVTSAAPDQLTVTVPDGATTGNIVISVNGHSFTGPVFTIFKISTILGVNPVCGPVGTTVTLSVDDFDADPSGLRLFFSSFYRVPATILSTTHNEIKVIVPPNALPEGYDIIGEIFGQPISFVNETGTVGASNEFSVQPFIVTDFTPKSGKRGSQVTILGSNFNTNLSTYYVVFERGDYALTRATITAVTPTEITVTVPDDAITGSLSMGLVQGTGAGRFHNVFTVLP